jgi:hydroxymethylbilane synthase
LEEALLSGEIDVAVHSLKDLPTELQPELELAATLPRHDPVDVLISKPALREIPLSGIVPTSSLRRVRQIAVYRPDLQVTEVRGNVPTRIAKLCANFAEVLLTQVTLLQRIATGLPDPCVLRNPTQVFSRQEPLSQRGKSNAADAFFLERTQQRAFRSSD